MILSNADRQADEAGRGDTESAGELSGTSAGTAGQNSSSSDAKTPQEFPE